MHDAVAAEASGTPAVAVMTSDFASAAEVMGKVLGVPGYEFAVIEHPVSSASDRGLEARAERTLAAVRRLALRSS